MEIKHNFKELKVWQKSRVLAKNIFVVTKKYPREERFEIVSQMRRSVISIASNIAEGSGRNSNKDFRRFLDIALSSAYELETQVIISFDLEYISEKDYKNLSNDIHEVEKMIYGFRKSLSNIKKLYSFILTLF